MKHAIIPALLKLAEIGAGAGLAIYLDTHVKDLPPGMSIALGFLAALIFLQLDAVVTAHLNQKALEDSYSKLADMVNSRYAQHESTLNRRYDEHENRLKSLALALAGENFEMALTKLGFHFSGRTLNDDETSRVWNQLTWAVQHNYKATNYIKIDKIYEDTYAKDIVTLQKAKCCALKDFWIKKVFISDDRKEMTCASGQNVIATHTEENMAIKWMLRDRIAATALDKIGGAKNLDFAIFDEKVVLVWHLNGERKIIGSEVFIDSEIAKKFDDFFTYLLGQAEEPPKPGTPVHHAKTA